MESAFCGDAIMFTIIDQQHGVEVKVLGHFRSATVSPYFLLNQSASLNVVGFLLATLTGSKSSGSEFAFNPGRRWEYRTELLGPKHNHVFTIYYVVKGIVRGIVDSTMFHIVRTETSKSTSQPQGQHVNTHEQDEKNAESGHSKKEFKALDVDDAKFNVEPQISQGDSSVDDSNSSFSKMLYSFQDQDDPKDASADPR